MPYRSRILEVTASPRLRARSPFLPPAPCSRMHYELLAVATGCLLLGSALSQAQNALPEPATLQQASDIDWVPLDELSAEQCAGMDATCRGRYLEPDFSGPADSSVTAGATVIDGLQLDADAEGQFRLEGGLQVRSADSLVEAQRGSYDMSSRVLLLQEAVRIRRPGLLITGNSARVDELAARSEISLASYLLHDSAIRGTAERISYDAEGELITIDNGAFTRCEPGDNSWLLRGSDIRLDRSSGRGTARGVTLAVKNVPVFYLPWISFPINDERASGLLAPVLGSTRDGGFDIAVPYYFNLAPHYDLTLTPRLQTERGLMLGAEGRYRGQAHQQVLNLQYLPDDQLFDEARKDIPGSDSPPEATRWLLDYQLNASLRPRWSFGVDYAAVSDDEYFQDLGSDGLLSTAQSFLRRNAVLRYSGRDWQFRATAQAFQIIDPSVSALAEPYRKLPDLSLRGDFRSDWGLEYGIDSNYTHFDRNLSERHLSQARIDAGVLVEGSRLSLTPSLSYPWSNSYAFATPTLKYKYASWELDKQALGRSSSPTRGVASASLDSGLIFERDTSLFGADFLQTLEPRLFYLFNEYEDQSDIPLFDSSELTFSYSQLFREDRFSGKDRVGDANQLTLALSSRLYDAEGQEQARLSLGQIRHFRDRRVTLRELPGDIDREDSSALVGEFSVALGQHWRAGAYLEWNTEARELDVGNFQFQYQSDINRILNLGYRYREVPGAARVNGIERRIDQTDVSGVWPLNDRWGLVGRWNYDLANKRNLETIAGLEYSNCCWTARVVARSWIDNNDLFQGIEEENRGVFLQFELKGLGSVLGGNVIGILNNGIHGYREREYASNAL